MRGNRVKCHNLTVCLIALAGAAVLLATFSDAADRADLLLLAFMLLAVLVEGVPLPVLHRAVSLSFALSFPAFILYGPAAAVWINGLGSLAGRFVLARQGFTPALFSAGRAVLGMAAAGFTYQLAGGGPDRLQSLNWLPLSLVSPIFLGVNVLLDRLAVRSSRSERAEAMFAISAHIVLTAFGLLLAASLVLQGFFAFFLVAVSLGAVIYLMRLHDQLQMANNEMRTLHETAGKLNTTLRLEGVFGIVAQAVDDVMRPQYLRLFLFQEGEHGLEVTAAHAHGEDPGEGVLSVCNRLAVSIGREGRPLLSQDLLHDPHLGHLAAEAGVHANLAVRSLLAVPLVSEGHLLGVLVAGHREPRMFNREHLRLASIMSTQVAAAIKNAILYQKTENMAITDHLTNLYNYRYLYLRLEDELSKARAQSTRVSLLYLDLDRFKQCNDCFGHLAGDYILYQFAQVLRQSIRQSDIAARYAGDEFVVILPGTGREEAWEAVARIKEAVQGHTFQIRGRNIVTRLGLSAGVACFPDDAQTVDELIFLADRSMYQDKVAGEDVG